MARIISYLNSNQENWKESLPNDNWCLILISDNGNEAILEEIINESISHNVGYICGVGARHDFIHNYSDYEYTRREVGLSGNNKPKYDIMTVGDNDFEEGLWFGINLTFNPEVEITNILIVDESGLRKTEIFSLISKFEKGYLPKEKDENRR